MIESFKMDCRELRRTIRVSVNLPDKYYNSNRYYSSVFFLDGQNLYDETESYHEKVFHMENLIPNLEEQEKEAIYIGIWSANNEDQRNLENENSILSDFIIHQIYPFLSLRYRLNPYKYSIGCGKSAYPALKLCENDLFKGAILLSPVISSELLSEIKFDANKLYYFYAGKNELNGIPYHITMELKELVPNAQISFDDGSVHNEEGWSKNLLEALQYLVL